MSATANSSNPRGLLLCSVLCGNPEIVNIFCISNDASETKSFNELESAVLAEGVSDDLF